MPSPFLVILGIIAVGAVLVVLPVVLISLEEHRRPKKLRCPEAGTEADVTFDAARAVRGALVGRPWFSVTDCSLWPERAGCVQRCAKIAAAASASTFAA